MRRGGSAGFTVVETMIVLAVSGLLFISFTGMVVGQQGKTQFKNAVSNLSADIQAVIGQVSSGYYPVAAQQFSCVADGTKPKVTTTPSVGGMGSNKDCMFLGRAIIFEPAVGDEQKIRIHTLIGLRKTASLTDPANLNMAGTMAMAPGASTDTLDLSTSKALHFGMTLQSARADAGGGTVAGFAVVTAQNGQLNGNALDTGVVLPSIIPIHCTAGCEKGVVSTAGVDLISATLNTGGSSVQAGGVKLCLLSATTSQSALLRVGAGASNSSIETTIHNSRDCTG